MIGLRDDRGEEGDWVWASISRGGQTNRSYSDRHGFWGGVDRYPAIEAEINRFCNQSSW
jgi:hypothetical protein